MARPKEFDQEKALRKAIRLFSQQGFSATSTDDLMRVMEVGRQSMYDTFGDKRALFLKALELYVTESVHSINVELERPGSAHVLRQTLMHVLTRAKKQGEISSDANLDSMADFFESTLAGIRMAAKAGKSRHALRNMAAFASRAYMASDRRITPE
jgi:TetR/AcrR family transcriptional repressor of nem operon